MATHTLKYNLLTIETSEKTINLTLNVFKTEEKYVGAKEEVRDLKMTVVCLRVIKYRDKRRRLPGL